jgi:ATP-dependent Lhr-like helicase
VALRGRGVRTFVSHASLAAEERRRSERAFAESRDCVVVATSTLELGVDVGDLDRVIQVDCVGTVSGFLQRLGRSGRRGGATRNCLFLATSHEALLQAAGLVRLWSAGWVEPVFPPPAPLHILAQQLIGLALQEGRLARSGWREWLGGLPLASDDEARRVLAHLVAAGMLAADEGMLFVGPAAERSFGRRHFRELTAVFAADPELVVLHGRTEVGSVHPLAVAVAGEGPRRLLLAGQSWQVTHVDWDRRRCFVRPADGGGRARWPGVPQLLHGPLCRAMREVALGAEPGVPLTARAAAWLPRAREELAGRVSDSGSVVAADATGRTRWWTWAGGRANATLAAALPGLAEAPGRVENLSIRLKDGVDVGELRRALRGLDLEEAPAPAVLEEAVRGLKFSEALPLDLAVRVLQERLRDPEGAAWVLRQPGPVVVRSPLADR